jgi:hypothetical protein
MDGVRAARHIGWAGELQEEHRAVKGGGKKGVAPVPGTGEVVHASLGV